MGASVVVPAANLGEARLAAPTAARGARNLVRRVRIAGRARRGRSDALDDFRSRRHSASPLNAPRSISPMCADRLPASARCSSPRAGGHSSCWSGRPAPARACWRSGLPGLLPALDGDDALDVASIASVSARGFNPLRLRPPAVPRAASHARRPARSSAAARMRGPAR